MRGGNFVIASNNITTNDSNNAIQSDVAVQINQDGFLNLPDDINIYGDVSASRDMDVDGVATFKRHISIKPNTLNTAAGTCKLLPQR